MILLEGNNVNHLYVHNYLFIYLFIHSIIQIPRFRAVIGAQKSELKSSLTNQKFI